MFRSNKNMTDETRLVNRFCKPCPTPFCLILYEMLIPVVVKFQNWNRTEFVASIDAHLYRRITSILFPEGWFALRIIKICSRTCFINSRTIIDNRSSFRPSCRSTSNRLINLQAFLSPVIDLRLEIPRFTFRASYYWRSSQRKLLHPRHRISEISERTYRR